MRTVSHQTEGSERPRFRYEPDRHYVRAQIPDAHWDGGNSLVPTTPDQFLDIWDEEKGEFAYRMEASGAERDGQRITNSPRLALVSCSKSYAERMMRASERSSRGNMAQLSEPLKLSMGQEIPESVQQLPGVDVAVAFRKADKIRLEREALMQSKDI